MQLLYKDNRAAPHQGEVRGFFFLGGGVMAGGRKLMGEGKGLGKAEEMYI